MSSADTNTIKHLAALGFAFSQTASFFNGDSPHPPDEALPFIETYQSLVRINSFFDAKSLSQTLAHWGSLLTEEKLTSWVKTSAMTTARQGKAVKNIALIMAANIPLVGFHDLLAILITGHRALIRKTKIDEKLYAPIRFFLQKQSDFFYEKIIFIEGQIKNFDAIIATGNDNSYRYFEYYFSKYPSILRHHRNSVAILNGQETTKQLTNLGADIMDYYGMGCRSVSKIFIPEGFEIQKLLKVLPNGLRFLNSEKYMNNYRYQKACYMMGGFVFFDNEYLILKEGEGFQSPIGVLHYEYYRDRNHLEKQLAKSSKKLQCIYSHVPAIYPGIYFSKIGTAQAPALDDYADGIDTLDFLQKL